MSNIWHDTEGRVILPDALYCDNCGRKCTIAVYTTARANWKSDCCNQTITTGEAIIAEEDAQLLNNPDDN